MTMAQRKAFKNGFKCAKFGGTIEENPFKGIEDLFNFWIEGFKSFLK